MCVGGVDFFRQLVIPIPGFSNSYVLKIRKPKTDMYINFQNALKFSLFEKFEYIIIDYSNVGPNPLLETYCMHNFTFHLSGCVVKCLNEHFAYRCILFYMLF